MRILLLGGSGYLGSILKNELDNAGLHTVNPPRNELDLTVCNSLTNYLRGNGVFDLVINCAVFQKTGDSLVQHSKDILLQNTLINATLIQAFADQDFSFRFMTIGASCAYSKYSGTDSYLVGELDESVKCFASPKRNLVQMLKICDPSASRWTVFVPGTLVGPGEQLDDDKKHFFNGSIYRAAKCRHGINDKFEIYGNKDAVRDLSLASGVAKTVVQGVKTFEKGIVKLSPDFQITVGQLYDCIFKYILDSSRAQARETQFNAQKFKGIDSFAKINLVGRDATENQDFASLIMETYDYYMKNLHLNECS